MSAATPELVRHEVEVVKGTYHADGYYTERLSNGTWRGSMRVVRVDPAWELSVARMIEKINGMRWLALYGPGWACEGMGV